VIFEAAAATATRGNILAPQINLVKAKGSLVNIPKRIPPPLPPRSPMRSSNMVDEASGRSPSPSPVKDGFEEVELNGSVSDATTERQAETPVTNGIETEDRAVEEETSATHPEPEPTTEEQKAEVPTDTLSPESAIPKADGDSEHFHSVPSSPLEVAH